MLIRLYNFTGDRRALHKASQMNLISEMQGSLNEPSDVVNPVIYVDSLKNETGGFDPTVCNYAYIQEFKRYYFINDLKAISDNIWEISMHSDGLMSFETQIEDLDCYGIRTASTTKQTPDVFDEKAPYKACDWIANYSLINLTNDYRWILVTAG